jgi:hypothetical protein
LIWGKYNEGKAVEVTRIKSDIPLEKGGPLTVAKIVIVDSGRCVFSVNGEDIETISVGSNAETLDLKRFDKCLHNLSDSFVFCAGLPADIFKTALTAIRYEPQGLKKKSFPFERWASQKCVQWYPLRHNASRDERQCP